MDKKLAEFLETLIDKIVNLFKTHIFKVKTVPSSKPFSETKEITTDDVDKVIDFSKKLGGPPTFLSIELDQDGQLEFMHIVDSQWRTFAGGIDADIPIIVENENWLKIRLTPTVTPANYYINSSIS